MVACDHAGGRGQGIGALQHGVRRGHRGFGGGVGAHHVAEIHESHHAARLERVRPGGDLAHQHVVVVAVPVDHAGAQVREEGRGACVVEGEEAFHEGAPRRVGHLAEIPFHHGAAVPQVPVQGAIRRWVREVLEHAVRRAEEAAQFAEQLGRTWPHLGEGDTGDVLEEPGQEHVPLSILDRSERLAVESRADMGEAIERARRGQEGEGLVLALQDSAVLACLGEFQHERVS